MQHPQKLPARRRLSRRAQLALAFSALALAAALVCLLPAIRRAFPAAPGPAVLDGRTARTLRTLSADDIDTVTLTHAAGDTFTLAMRGGALYLMEDGALLTLDAAAEADLRQVVTCISAEDVVTQDAREVREHLAAMGLNHPDSVAEIALRSGETVTVEIGAAVPLTSYSYLRVSGDAAVYMAGAGMAETLALTRGLLLPVEGVAFAPSLVDSVALQTAEGVLTVRYGEFPALVSPLAYPADTDAANALLAALGNFRLGTREAALNDASRAAYGLDNPLCVVTVSQRAGLANTVDESGGLSAQPVEAQQTTFTLGRAEGEYFYTCAYGGSVYLVSRFLAEPLAQATLAGLASRHPADVGGAELSRVVIEAPEGSHAMTIARTERVLPNNELETDEDGNAVYDTHVTLDGEAAPVERYTALADALSALTVSGDAPPGWQPAAEPRWRITLTTAGGVIRVVEGYRLDVFTDVAVVDGTALHTLSAEEISRVVGGF